MVYVLTYQIVCMAFIFYVVPNNLFNSLEFDAVQIVYMYFYMIALLWVKTWNSPSVKG